MACKGRLETCAVQDDLTRVLESMRTADLIVAATPVYGGYASGQFKCFMDRCYSFLLPDFMTNPQPSRMPPGKKVVLVITQGNPNPSFFDHFVNQLEAWATRNWRAEALRVIKGYGLGPESNLEPFLREAEDLAGTMRT